LFALKRLANKKISRKYLRKTPFLSNADGAIGILRGAGVFQYWMILYDNPDIKIRAAI